MTTAIERAAMAICDEWDKTFDHEDPDSFDRLARAALATTREPTPEMILAGADALRASLELYERGSAEAVWRAMHDAMMEEGS